MEIEDATEGLYTLCINEARRMGYITFSNVTASEAAAALLSSEGVGGHAVQVTYADRAEDEEGTWTGKAEYLLHTMQYMHHHIY
jgi:hypothetical protein